MATHGADGKTKNRRGKGFFETTQSGKCSESGLYCERERGERGCGGGEIGHLQMPSSPDGDLCVQSPPRASTGSAVDAERVCSHSKATTSMRCGFQWLAEKLKENEEAWLINDQNEANEDLDEFHDYTWHFRHKAVP